MRILVVGDGKVGKAITSHICREGHEVVAIDNDQSIIEEIVSEYDVMALCGNGASYDVLKSAGVEKMDLVVAVTPNDETNILACLVAKKMGAKDTVARVRNYEYNNQIKEMQADLGISMTINPEYESANEILKIINFPEAIRVDTFAHGNVDLIELFIPEDSPLVGKSLISIYQKYQIRILVCAVQRQDEVFIPSGNFVLQAKDKIHITAEKNNLRAFISKAGFIKSKMKDVLIIGGGKIGLYLGEELLKYKYHVKIIEKDYKRCVELNSLLPNAEIINGDGCNQDVLVEEGLLQSDAFVCLSGIDEENIILSLFAHKNGIKKIVTKVDKSSFAGLLESIGVASIISPKEITASRIVSYVRAKNNIRGNNVITLYKLVNNKVEALEFIAKENSRILDICLKDLKIRDKVLIVGIFRNGETIIPSGEDMIMLNDSVIVVTTNQFLDALEDILE